MTEPRNKLSLDTALHEWPHVEKPTTEWDERARSVMERLGRGERGATAAYVSDDALFADPLAAIEEEERAAFAKRERDRKSLQELAKMAPHVGKETPPPSPVVVASATESSKPRVGEAKGEDSGLIHLASATMAAAPAAPSISEAPRSSSPAPVDSAPTRPSNVVVLPAKKKSSALGILIGGVFALSAAAAGTFFYLQLNKQPVTVATMTQPTVVATQAPAPPATTSEAVIDPNALPAAQPTVAAAPKATAHPPSAVGTVAMAPKEGPKDAPAKVAEKDLPKTQTGSGGALGDEMRKSVGEIDVKPAAAPSGQNAATGSVPTKPSQGAVAGAIGAVLPQARECLGPDDPISRAQIVFASDGSVQSVSVSGAAAGKPTEACIKSALMKAKLPPFAEPSYTAPITIRHK